MSAQAKHFYAFGPFRLDTEERVLLRGGQPVPLNPKAVETLVILVQKAGHLVDKDELMKQVWPDAFVEEGNLSKNIFFLRKVLGRSDEGREYIETVARRGYRFAAKVRSWSEEDPTPAVAAEGASGTWPPTEKPAEIERIDRGRDFATAARPEPLWQAPDRMAPPASAPAEKATSASPDLHPAGQKVSGARRRWLTVVVVIALTVSAALVSVWVVVPPPTPVVVRTVQLTHFGRVNGSLRLVSDGVQLYFSARNGGQWTLARVRAAGGEPEPIVTPFRSTVLYDISPDRSDLLLGSRSVNEDETPLWVLPTSGGSPRRLGELIAHDAAWSPDGHSIVYASASDLYRAKGDGSESRKLVSTAGFAHYPRWSPDGRLLRFTLTELASHTESLWEVTAEGRNLHRLLPGWRGSPTDWGNGESGGDWTPDGKYFIFRSVRAHTASIWAIRERGGFLRRRSNVPLLLTPSSLHLWNTLVAGNGKRVLFGAGNDNRELQRYDSRLNQFVPYLSGVSARWVSFSGDGRWVAYVTMPEFVLWRSRVDGSGRLQLTFPPMGVGAPRWSPDGKRLAFAPGGQVCLLSLDGGNPEPVTAERYPADDPDWSPGGDSLLFDGPTPGGGIGSRAIYRVDLKTHQVSQLPGSQGMRFPAFSPDGKYVAAISETPANRLMLFGVQSQRWTELAQANWFYTPYWSRDGKYLYTQDLAGVEQPVLRVRISDHKTEVITTLKQFARADAIAYSFAGLTPDGEPLASLIRSDSDIYALDVDFP